MNKPRYLWPYDQSKGFPDLKDEVPRLLQDHAQYENAREFRDRLSEYQRDMRTPEEVRALVEEYVEAYDPF